jgi:hypothetical protein
MKFLVLYREDSVMSSVVPLPALAEAIEATGHWITEVKKSRKATEAAFMNPDHGGMAVFDVTSAVELNELVESCPARPFCKVETIPLIDEKEWEPSFQKSKARMMKMWEQLQATMGPKR